MAPVFELKGKTALVTGAAKRLGREIALALADKGMHLVLHYRQSLNEVKALAEECQAKGVKAYTVSADLMAVSGVPGMLAKALGLAGPLDVLVNSASIFEESRLNDFVVEDLYRNVNVNAMAPLLLARKFHAQGRPGAIVNLLDCRIADYDEAHVAYHLSKRMLFSLTRMMAVEFAPAVRVNAVAPGLILPPAGKDRAYLDSLAHTNPLNCCGAPEDVVSAVMFLLESPFVTGQVIYVDGGRHLRGSMYGE